MMMRYLATIFQYTALSMIGMCAGGICSGIFSIGDTLIGLAFAVLVIGGFAKVFSMVLGVQVIRYIDTKQKKRIAGLLAFAAGFLAVCVG